MRYNFSILILLFLSICGCNSEKNFAKNGKHVYCVFDSLEKVIKNEIQSHGYDSVCGIGLDLACQSCAPEYTKKDYCAFGLVVIFKDSRNSCTYYNSILKNSNMFLQIGNSQYPIILLGLDDVFTRNKPDKQKAKREINSTCVSKTIVFNKCGQMILSH
jgi:hypothetical protein